MAWLLEKMWETYDGHRQAAEDAFSVLYEGVVTDAERLDGVAFDLRFVRDRRACKIYKLIADEAAKKFGAKHRVSLKCKFRLLFAESTWTKAAPPPETVLPDLEAELGALHPTVARAYLMYARCFEMDREKSDKFAMRAIAYYKTHTAKESAAAIVDVKDPATSKLLQRQWAEESTEVITLYTSVANYRCMMAFMSPERGPAAERKSAALKAEAEELFQRALNFGFLPDYLISCRGSYGGLLMRMGRIEEAVAQMRTALDQVNEAKKQGRPIMATEQEIYFVKEEFKRALQARNDLRKSQPPQASAPPDAAPAAAVPAAAPQPVDTAALRKATDAVCKEARTLRSQKQVAEAAALLDKFLLEHHNTSAALVFPARYALMSLELQLSERKIRSPS